MSKKITERIKNIAFNLLREHPDGLRYSELVKLFSEEDDKLNRNTINGRSRRADKLASSAE